MGFNVRFRSSDCRFTLRTGFVPLNVSIYVSTSIYPRDLLFFFFFFGAGRILSLEGYPSLYLHSAIPLEDISRFMIMFMYHLMRL